MGVNRELGILVVGGGVAGLQAANALLRSGFRVTILEEQGDVGGVWCCNHVGSALQVPWKQYMFPDFPVPQELHEHYPKGFEVQQYVQAYAQHFGLYEHIRFRCRLERISQDPRSGRWRAVFCDLEEAQHYRLTADFVVICSGILRTPFTPKYPGQDQFRGHQLHARHLTTVEVARGKNVVVVGSGKSGLDCAAELALTNVAKSVTLLYRNLHWPVPRELGPVSVQHLLFTRATCNMMPDPYYAASGLSRAASAMVRPFKQLVWRGLEAVVERKFKIGKDQRASVPLWLDLYYGAQVFDQAWASFMRSDRVQTLQGRIRHMSETGLVLEDGRELACDVLLYCTGYQPSLSFLDPGLLESLAVEDDGLYLYRNMLHPAVRNLAFIGSNVSTFNNILTAALQSKWLVKALRGELLLPSRAEMLKDIEAQKRWRRAVMAPQHNRGAVYMPYTQAYHDQLLKDIKGKPKRKGWNPLRECLQPYTALDYSEGVATANLNILTSPLVTSPVGTCASGRGYHSCTFLLDQMNPRGPSVAAPTSGALVVERLASDTQSQPAPLMPAAGPVPAPAPEPAPAATALAIVTLPPGAAAVGSASAFSTATASAEVAAAGSACLVAPDPNLDPERESTGSDRALQSCSVGSSVRSYQTSRCSAHATQGGMEIEETDGLFDAQQRLQELEQIQEHDVHIDMQARPWSSPYNPASPPGASIGPTLSHPQPPLSSSAWMSVRPAEADYWGMEPVVVGPRTLTSSQSTSALGQMASGTQSQGFAVSPLPPNQLFDNTVSSPTSLSRPSSQPHLSRTSQSQYIRSAGWAPPAGSPRAMGLQQRPDSPTRQPANTTTPAALTSAPIVASASPFSLGAMLRSGSREALGRAFPHELTGQPQGQNQHQQGQAQGQGRGQGQGPYSGRSRSISARFTTGNPASSKPPPLASAPQQPRRPSGLRPTSSVNELAGMAVAASAATCPGSAAPCHELPSTVQTSTSILGARIVAGAGVAAGPGSSPKAARPSSTPLFGNIKRQLASKLTKISNNIAPATSGQYSNHPQQQDRGQNPVTSAPTMQDTCSAQGAVTSGPKANFATASTPAMSSPLAGASTPGTFFTLSGSCASGSSSAATSALIAHSANDTATTTCSSAATTTTHTLLRFAHLHAEGQKRDELLERGLGHAMHQQAPSSASGRQLVETLLTRSGAK